MALKLQVVFDCADPDVLASFYAEALHYKLQDPPKGFESWESFLEAQGVPKEEWHTSSAIVDPERIGPRIYFQQMDTPKLGKNRLHIDINASEGMGISLEKRKRQVNKEVDRLIGVGAKKHHELEEDGEYCVIMQDPEGNEFCVQ